MIRLLRFAALLLALSLAPRAAAQSPTGGLQQLLSIEGCGKPLPLVIGNIDQFRQFQVDLEAYRRNEAQAMAGAISALCAASPKQRELIDHGLRQVRVINAQGADEPTPRLGGHVLLVDFAGGSFDTARFRNAVAAALQHGSKINPGFNCAKAASPIEKLICDEPDLTLDDANLAETYKSALQTLKGQAPAVEHLRAEQRQWLGQRDARCSGSTDFSNPLQADSAVNCLREAYDARIAALGAVADAPVAVNLPADTGVDGSYTSDDGKLAFDSQADGSARFTLETTSKNGVCSVDGKAVREGTSNYTFADTGSECKLMFRRDGDTISVSSQGSCYNSYCGVHAPGLDGDYTRRKGGHAK